MKHTLETPLGNIEYTDSDRIALPRGLPGFESARSAIWYTSPQYDPIKWFLLEDQNGAVLPLIDPFLITNNYEPVIQDQFVELLEVQSVEEVAVLCVATPKKEQPPTINLRSPIVINAAKRIAVQVILEDESLPVRYTWDPANKEAAPC